MPVLVGKSRELLLAEEHVRWEQAFLAALSSAGQTEEQLIAPPKSQAWKIALARQVRDAHGVSTSWLARRMGFGSPSYLRKLLCAN